MYCRTVGKYTIHGCYGLNILVVDLGGIAAESELFVLESLLEDDPTTDRVQYIPGGCIATDFYNNWMQIPSPAYHFSLTSLSILNPQKCLF